MNKGWQHVWIAFLNHSVIICSTITLCRLGRGYGDVWLRTDICF
jgi:hypothetical protein